MATTITQSPSKNDSQFITEATRVASILSKRTERPPRVSHSFEGPKKRDARNRKRERKRERESEPIRNAPYSNRFSSGARSSCPNQTLTSADASRQSNLSRELDVVRNIFDMVSESQGSRWGCSSSKNDETLQRVSKNPTRSLNTGDSPTGWNRVKRKTAGGYVDA